MTSFTVDDAEFSGAASGAATDRTFNITTAVQGSGTGEAVIFGEEYEETTIYEITTGEYSTRNVTFTDSTMRNITSTAYLPSKSAPLLAVVSILAFITLLLLFVGMIRYRFCKRASYYIDEMVELKTPEEKRPLRSQPPTPVINVCDVRKNKEWLV